MKKELHDIGLDIDGVLRNFVSSLYETMVDLENFKGKEPVVEDWDTSKYYPNVENFWNKVYHIKKYSEQIFWYKANLYHNADKILEILNSFPNRIHIISHQKGYSIEYTNRWIAWMLKYEIPDIRNIKSVYLIPPEQSKADIIPGKIMIDDKPETIKACGEDNSILIRRPWNKNYNPPYVVDMSDKNFEFEFKLALSDIMAKRPYSK